MSEPSSQGTKSEIIGELLQDRLAVIGLLIISLTILMALIGPIVSPHDPTVQALSERLTPPMWLDGGSLDHILGTDHLGRDVLSRVIAGARVSLTVAIATVLLSGTFGIMMGVVAGYSRSYIGDIVTRFIEMNVAFPGLLMSILIVAMLGPSMITLIIAISINGWMVYATVTRSLIISLRERPYVEAAEVIGCSNVRILFRYLLPNLSSSLLTLGVLELARVVLAEAALSFLNLGIQPPASSWGLDVAQGKNYMMVAWWPVAFPGLAIVAFVLSINLVASWARISMDPQAREQRFAQRIQKDRSRLIRNASSVGGKR